VSLLLSHVSGQRRFVFCTQMASLIQRVHLWVSLGANLRHCGLSQTWPDAHDLCSMVVFPQVIGLFPMVSTYCLLPSNLMLKVHRGLDMAACHDVCHGVLGCTCSVILHTYGRVTMLLDLSLSFVSLVGPSAFRSCCISYNPTSILAPL